MELVDEKGTFDNPGVLDVQESQTFTQCTITIEDVLNFLMYLRIISVSSQGFHNVRVVVE